MKNEIITYVSIPGYPKYGTEVLRKNRQPDLRNTLFWLPDLKIDAAKHEVSFYTSDIAGRYRISIEGLVNDSIPVSAIGEFRVETNY